MKESINSSIIRRNFVDFVPYQTPKQMIYVSFGSAAICLIATVIVGLSTGFDSNLSIILATSVFFCVNAGIILLNEEKIFDLNLLASVNIHNNWWKIAGVVFGAIIFLLFEYIGILLIILYFSVIIGIIEVILFLISFLIYIDLSGWNISIIIGITLGIVILIKPIKKTIKRIQQKKIFLQQSDLVAPKLLNKLHVTPLFIIAAVEQTGQILIWDKESYHLLADLHSCLDAVEKIIIHKNHLYSLSDNIISAWDLANGFKFLQWFPSEAALKEEADVYLNYLKQKEKSQIIQKLHFSYTELFELSHYRRLITLFRFSHYSKSYLLQSYIIFNLENKFQENAKIVTLRFISVSTHEWVIDYVQEFETRNVYLVSLHENQRKLWLLYQFKNYKTPNFYFLQLYDPLTNSKREIAIPYENVKNIQIFSNPNDLIMRVQLEKNDFKEYRYGIFRENEFVEIARIESKVKQGEIKSLKYYSPREIFIILQSEVLSYIENGITTKIEDFCCVFCISGMYLLIAINDEENRIIGQLKIYNIDAGMKFLRTHTIHFEKITDIQVLGNIVFTIAEDRTIQINSLDELLSNEKIFKKG